VDRRLEDVTLYRVAGRQAQRICRCKRLRIDEQQGIVELAAVRLVRGMTMLAIDDIIEAWQGDEAVYRLHSVTAERLGQDPACWRGTFDWLQPLHDGEPGRPARSG
jgi:hypothetical protein